MKDQFKLGARAVFDSILTTAVNTDDNDKSILLAESAIDALEAVSPECAQEWRNISELRAQVIDTNANLMIPELLKLKSIMGREFGESVESFLAQYIEALNK